MVSLAWIIDFTCCNMDLFRDMISFSVFTHIEAGTTNIYKLIHSAWLSTDIVFFDIGCISELWFNSTHFFTRGKHYSATVRLGSCVVSNTDPSLFYHNPVICNLSAQVNHTNVLVKFDHPSPPPKFFCHFE